jgi:predicted transcriptional regulator
MRRSKEEIVCQILELCENPASKTRVVYLCNLNFRTVCPHLERLITAGLLEASGGSIITYQTTAKGLEVLGYMKALKIVTGDLY